MQASTIHFPSSLRLRVPRGLPEALQIAARQRHTTPAEWVRQTLLRGLAEEGVRLADQAHDGRLCGDANARSS
jgi:hypothetical protein